MKPHNSYFILQSSLIGFAKCKKSTKYHIGSFPISISVRHRTGDADILARKTDIINKYSFGFLQDLARVNPILMDNRA